MVAPLTVACSHCGAKLKLKSAAAVGKKVACPKCTKPFVVKAPAEEVDDFGDLPMDDFGGGDEESDAEQDEAPVRRKGGSSKGAAPAKGKKKRGKSSSSDMGAMVMTVLFVLLGVGALGGAGYAVYSFLPSGGGGLTAYMPENTDVLIHAKVDSVLTSPVVSPLVSDPQVKTTIEKMSEVWGFAIKDIDSITVGIADILQNSAPASPRDVFTNARFVAVLKLKGPVDPAQFASKVTPPLTATQYNGQTYYLGQQGGKSHGFYKAGDNILVAGTDAELKAAIDGKGAAPAKSRFKFVDSSQHFVVALAPKDPTVLKKAMDYESFKTIGGTKIASNESLISGTSFGIRVTGDVSLLMDQNFISSSSVKASMDALKADLSKSVAELEQQKAQFGMMAMMMPALPKLMDQATTSLKNAKVTSSGSRLRTEVTFPGSMVADIKSLASTAMAMQGMGGGGGFPEIPGGATPPDFTADAPMPPGSYTGGGPGGSPTPMGNSTPMPPGGYNPMASGPPGGYSTPMGPGGSTPMPGNYSTPMAPDGAPPGGYSAPMGPTPMPMPMPMPGNTPMAPGGAPPGGYSSPMAPGGAGGAPPGPPKNYGAPMGGNPNQGGQPMSKTPMKPK